MVYKKIYKTPECFSDIIMNSDGEYLTGLWFEGSRDSFKHVIDCEEKDLEIFKETGKWLDIYFSGRNPNFTPKYKIKRTPVIAVTRYTGGSTAFQIFAFTAAFSYAVRFSS